MRPPSWFPANKRLLAEEIQVHGQKGQALVKVVVQFARDSPPFGFLRMDEPAGQHLQFALTLSQRFFDLHAFGDINN